MKYIFLAFICIIGFFNASITEAQALPQTTLSIVLTPAVPSPGETVYAELQGQYAVVTSNMISWYLDGVLIDSGQARRFINFTAPNKEVTLEAVVSGNQNLRVSQKINSGIVDLVWEAETYTPPFYAGKSLFGRQTNIRLTAIPFLLNTSGSRIATESLIYTWDKNGTILGTQSGTGKSSIIISSGSLDRDLVFSVTVSSADGNTRGKAAINLQVGSPEMHVYEHDPVLGILFNKDLVNGVLVSKSDTVLEAMPFYIGAESRLSPNLTTVWSFDGNSQAPDRPAITLQYDGTNSGNAEIGIRVKNRSSFMQEASAFIPVTFGQP